MERNLDGWTKQWRELTYPEMSINLYVYVLSMSCQCLVYILSMSCLCVVYVLSMCWLWCVVYVLSMCCLCVIYVLSMCYLCMCSLCVVYVLYMCCICVVYVSSNWRSPKITKGEKGHPLMKWLNDKAACINRYNNL